MKRAMFFVITVCLCYGSFFNAYAQTRRRQPRPQQKTSQSQKPPAEAGKPQDTPAKADKPQEVPPAEASKPQTPQERLEDWQTSYLKFVEEVVRTPAAERKTKFFDKEVRYEGVFKKLDLSSGGQLSRVDIELPKVEGHGPVIILDGLFLKPSAVDPWKNIKEGAKIRIRGKIAGIVQDSQPIGPTIFNVYALRVEDIELLGVAQQSSTAAPVAREQPTPAGKEVDLSGQWIINDERIELKLNAEMSKVRKVYCAGDRMTELKCLWVTENTLRYEISNQGFGLLNCSATYEPDAPEMKGPCVFGNRPTPKGFTAKRVRE